MIPRWHLRRAFAHQERIPEFPPIVGTVLAARGITKRWRANEFYQPLGEVWHDPLRLPGMDDALRRTWNAIKNNEIIALFGDYDVDGVTSIAVLYLGLKNIGAKTVTYLPDRFQEGYGLNKNAIKHLHGCGAKLLITADCGTSSVEEIEYANELGLDVIVLDHHSVPEVLPDALAVINPKREDSEYPFREMAAVGVSWRFLQVLYETIGVGEINPADYLDLVALGTVVDVAPLVDENRSIVTKGLEIMRESPRVGIEALLNIAGTNVKDITSETFGFVLGPRLNAAGRMEHAQIALDLLLEEDADEAVGIAYKLEALNKKRKELCEESLAEAESLIGDNDDPITIVGSENMNPGVVGIIAGRLAESRGRPAIVYRKGKEISRGSARTFGNFDIVGAIRKEKDILVRHGGHRAAAGLSIRNEDIPLFSERIQNTAAEQMKIDDLAPIIEIDAEAALGDLSGIEIKGLTRFEPCGFGNPRPVLLDRNVELLDARKIGADKSHLRLRVRDGVASWPAIAFRMAKNWDNLADRIDIVYSLKKEWRGSGWELEILDFAPTSEERTLVALQP